MEEIALFGSYARGEQSDAATWHSGHSAPLGWEFVDLHDYPELLDTKVELLTRGAVDRKPLLRQFIEKDLILSERDPFLSLGKRSP